MSRTSGCSARTSSGASASPTHWASTSASSSCPTSCASAGASLVPSRRGAVTRGRVTTQAGRDAAFRADLRRALRCSPCVRAPAGAGAGRRRRRRRRVRRLPAEDRRPARRAAAVALRRRAQDARERTTQAGAHGFGQRGRERRPRSRAGRRLRARVPRALPPREGPARAPSRSGCVLSTRTRRSDEMNQDVISRLAAANPVPTGRTRSEIEPLRLRRTLVAVAAAVAVAAPAAAFAHDIGNLLGISNGGTTVSRSDVLPGQLPLDQALEEMQVGDTMQLLGTVNGVRIYAARNAGGHICLAIDHVAATYEKGVLCDLTDPGFPSADEQALSFPGQLQGIAADDVATVAFVDAGGNVLDSAPVQDNLFASGTRVGMGAAAYLEALDANGNVLSKQKLPR